MNIKTKKKKSINVFATARKYGLHHSHNREARHELYSRSSTATEKRENRIKKQVKFEKI